MAGTNHVYAGVAATVGMQHSGTLGGVFRQEAGDKKWEQLKNGLADGAEVHAITVHPTDSDTLLVGSTKGLYRSANRGGKFERLALPDAEAVLLIADDQPQLVGLDGGLDQGVGPYQ